ncbi:hypothetical protein V494_00267 [Pseudogymnoascus sp. VKM F-4513 (FW-928)]|nr:hypothetical protein V494_00267 [Pseudogymnoascus sp. VKM F-4513 (FW-928)]
MLFTPIKVAIAMYAIGTTATVVTCFAKDGHAGAVTGTYTLTGVYQDAPRCESATWSSTSGANSCVWIKGDSAEKKWSTGTTDYPVNIFSDVGYNSKLKEAAC